MLTRLGLFHDQLGQSARMPPAAPDAPDALSGRSAVAGGKVLGASVSPQDRNLWRVGAVTKVTAAVTKVTAANMSNCRFGRCGARR